MASANETRQQDWLDTLGQNLQVAIYTLFAFAAAAAVGALIVAVRYRTEQIWWVLMLLLLCLASLGTGLMVQAGQQSSKVSPRDAARILVLVYGGFVGFFLTLIGISLGYIWRATVFGGPEKWQGEQHWQLWITLALFFFGLAVTFASFMLGRTEERTNPVMRRLVYGYNAVLTGVLLLSILTFVVILAYLYIPPTDWTASGMYTLGSRSVNLLKGLASPVKIYVLESERNRDVKTLLDNVQGVTDKVQVQYVSRGRDLDTVDRLFKQYRIVESEGLLVVYGADGREDHEFIRAPDLYGARDFQSRTPPPFRGEDALMTAVSYLAEGKKKPVVYFTQANGELDINDTDTSRPSRGAGALRERLEKQNYDIRALQLGPVAADKSADPRKVLAVEVPDDAAAVVIANPRSPFSAEALKALRQYASPTDPKKPKGKLIVLLDVELDRDGKMIQTGLESLLEEFNVEVGNNRALEAISRTQATPVVQAAVNADLGRRNEIASGFANAIIPLSSARTVKPRQAAAPGRAPTSYRADVLLVALGSSWAEEDLRSDLTALMKDLTENRPQEFRRKLQEMVPLAAVVTESGSDPADPHAFMRKPEERGDKPRMVVVGDATFVTNQNVSEHGGQIGFYDFFASMLAWVRERPTSIGIEPRKRETYTMARGADTTRMVMLPALLMACGVAGLGAGIWVVRRQ
jgi:hypothetical protein